MSSLEDLIAAVEREARRAPFPVDQPVYERANRDPNRPILCAGDLAAPVCFFGRDLGKDEIAAGEPLIGAGGRLVRAGVHAAWYGEPPLKSDRTVASALRHALLTNTVPYKPPGNKAYAEAVKDRFRPFIAELLARQWQGARVVTLGNEAFHWFARFAADPGDFDAFWARGDRYEAELACDLRLGGESTAMVKRVILCPLPHPSPLNARWYSKFPGLLAQRLSAVAGPAR
jgi:uracil-DNA glycosylase